MDVEKRAHDLALSFLSYQLGIERDGTDAEHDAEVFFDMYKANYDYFYELLTEGE